MKAKIILPSATVVLLIAFFVSLGMDISATSKVLIAAFTLGIAINTGIFSLSLFIK